MFARSFLTLLLLFPLTACSHRGPARQVGNSLVIDTPDFSVTVPGTWQPETALQHGANVIYSGTRREGPVERSFSVTACPDATSANGLNRREEFEAFLNGQRENEDSQTGRREKFTAQPIVEQGNLLIGGYMAVNVGAGRLGYTETIWDWNKGFMCYYDVSGLQGMASPREFGNEFNVIMATARLK